MLSDPIIFPQIDPVIVSIGPLAVRWYGLMYLIALGVAYWLAMREVKSGRSPYSDKQVSDLLFYGFLQYNTTSHAAGDEVVLQYGRSSREIRLMPEFQISIFLLKSLKIAVLFQFFFQILNVFSEIFAFHFSVIYMYANE